MQAQSLIFIYLSVEKLGLTESGSLVNCNVVDFVGQFTYMYTIIPTDSNIRSLQRNVMCSLYVSESLIYLVKKINDSSNGPGRRR